MSQIIKKLRNVDTIDHTYYGVVIAPTETYEIELNEIDGFLREPSLEQNIIDGLIIVNNGTSDLSNTDGWDWLNTMYLDTAGSVNAGKGILTFQAARNGTINENRYMNITDGCAMGEHIGWVPPWDGKIIAISIGRENVDASIIEVRINGQSTSAQLSTTNNKDYINTLNLSFNAGDSLSIYVKSGQLHRAIVTVFCTWGE